MWKFPQYLLYIKGHSEADIASTEMLNNYFFGNKLIALGD
jgi:hypothetical protein